VFVELVPDDAGEGLKLDKATVDGQVLSFDAYPADRTD
jgi:hypothetical protein